MEDAFFADVEKENTVESYSRYLEQFPKGKNELKAKQGIEKTHFLVAEQENSVPALEKFLHEFPIGKHAQDAQWRIAQLKDSLDGYQEFKKLYPRSPRHRLLANTYISYFKATQTPTADNLLEFFKNWKIRGISRVSSSELHELENLLIVKCSEAEMPEGYIILFDRTKDEKYLNKAYSLIETKEQEFMVVKRLKNNFFHLSDAQDHSTLSHDTTFLFNWDIETLKTKMKVKCASGAKKARYRVTFKISITVSYRRHWRGITWFRPEGYNKAWEETYVDTVAFIVPPARNGKLGKSSWEVVKFPEFQKYERKGALFLSREYFAKIIAQDFQNIVSVEQL